LGVITGEWENGGDCRKLQAGTKMVPHPHPSPPATPPGTEHKACSLSGISGPLYFGIYQRQRKQIAEKEKLEEASVTRRDGDGVRWERGR